MKIFEGILPDVMARSLKRLAIILWIVGIIHIGCYFYYIESYPPELTVILSIYSLLIGIALLAIVYFILSCVFLPSFIYLGFKNDNSTLDKDFAILSIIIFIAIIVLMYCICFFGVYPIIGLGALFGLFVWTLINYFFIKAYACLIQSKVIINENIAWVAIITLVFIFGCVYVGFFNTAFINISKYSVKKLGLGNLDFISMILDEKGCSVLDDYLVEYKNSNLVQRRDVGNKTCKIKKGRIISKLGSEYYISYPITNLENSPELKFTIEKKSILSINYKTKFDLKKGQGQSNFKLNSRLARPLNLAIPKVINKSSRKTQSKSKSQTKHRVTKYR